VAAAAQVVTGIQADQLYQAAMAEPESSLSVTTRHNKGETTMAAGAYVIRDQFDFARPVTTAKLPPIMVEGSENAHQVEITCKDGGAAANLSGFTCTGIIVNSNRQTFQLAGSIVGSVATVPLGQSAYLASGPLVIMVVLLKASISLPVYRAETTVWTGATETVYDPGYLVPNVTQLFAYAEAALAAAVTANDAAAAAALATATIITKADKAAFDYGYAGLAFYTAADWEQGAIDYTYGTDLNDEPYYSALLRLIPFIDGNVEIAQAKTGYFFDAVFKYDSSGAFISVNEIMSMTYTGFEAGYKYRFTLAKNEFVTITPAEYTNALLLSAELTNIALKSEIPDVAGKADVEAMNYGYTGAPFGTSDWEQGAIDYTYGTDLNEEPWYSANLRLIPFIDGNVDVAIAKSGYYIGTVFKYDSGGSFVSLVEINNVSYNGFEAGYKYRLTFVNDVGGAITAAESSNALLLSGEIDWGESGSDPSKADSAALQYGYTGAPFGVSDWEQGEINYTYGTPYNEEPYYSKTLRLIPLIDGNVDIALAKPGYLIGAVFKYDAGGSFIGPATEIASASFAGFEAGYKYRLTLWTDEYEAITPEECVNILLLSGKIDTFDTKLPYQSGDIRFTVSVNQNFDDNIATVDEVQDSETMADVSCILRLPDTYTPGGIPTKLALAAHGLGWYIAYPGTGSLDDFADLLAAGYALFDVNGSNDDNASAWGSPRNIQAAHKAYKYIVENYNVDPIIFIAGVSMGGMTAINFTNTFPEIAKAVGVFCPTLNLDTFTIGETGYPGIWDDVEDGQGQVAEEYNFAAASVYEPDKVCGYNPYLARSFTNDAGDRCTLFPVPIKIWHGIADPTIPYQISEEYAAQIKRAGVDCRLRLIAGVGHGSSATMKTELLYWFNRFS